MKLKDISANFLMITGMVTALCTTVVQVKDTFFPKEETQSQYPVIEQRISGLPEGSTVSKTFSVPESGDTVDHPPTTSSVYPQENPNRMIIWILFISAGVAFTAGVVVKKIKRHGD